MKFGREIKVIEVKTILLDTNHNMQLKHTLGEAVWQINKDKEAPVLNLALG